MYTPEQAREMVSDLVTATRQNGGTFDIRDGATRAIVATLTTHTVAARPKDMPRHLRPKAKLSKRQRDAVKRERRRIRTLS